MPRFALLPCFLNSSNGVSETVARDTGGIKRFDSQVGLGHH